mmetsp:Transcript_49323/g.139892  ORF Transcript_49323/g.139892 Transcript_49323/m.139892 type:complete len:232 (-) Transcript_49323:165-860(-)
MALCAPVTSAAWRPRLQPRNQGRPPRQSPPPVASHPAAPAVPLPSPLHCCVRAAALRARPPERGRGGRALYWPPGERLARHPPAAHPTVAQPRKRRASPSPSRKPPGAARAGPPSSAPGPRRRPGWRPRGGIRGPQQPPHGPATLDPPTSPQGSGGGPPTPRAATCPRPPWPPTAPSPRARSTASRGPRFCRHRRRRPWPPSAWRGPQWTRRRGPHWREGVLQQREGSDAT